MVRRCGPLRYLIVYFSVVTALLVIPAAAASVFSVVVVLMVTGAAYSAKSVVGVVPSRV